MIFVDDPSLIPKLCGICSFTVTSMIIGLLPLFIHEYCSRKQTSDSSSYDESRYKPLLSQLSAFGGGVLLSMTFLHLLPEIRHSFEKLKDKNVLNYKESLELPELLMCLGFLFLYVTEAIAHKLVSKGSDKHKHIEDCSVRFVNEVYAEHVSERSIHNSTETEGGAVDRGLNRDAREDLEKQAIAEIRNNSENPGNITVKCNLNHNEAVPCHNSSTIHFKKSSSKYFLLILALSIHEGFEGLAIGLEQQPRAVWYMILGVGAHKAVIAFCIGVQMVSSKLDRKIAVLYVVVFAVATSVGVAFGLFLYVESGIFSIILQGLASGTLLHVVFFELLKPHSEHTPFMGVVLGFITMAIVKYFSP